LSLSWAAYGEDTKEGTALQLGKEAVVRSAPESDAPPLGRLPTGTILTSRGVKKGKFILVDVELENDESLEGWINVSTLKETDNDEVTEDTKPKSVPATVRKRKHTVQVPQDELSVLKRDPTFVYGLQLGANYSFITTNQNSYLYQNPGFAAHLEAGLFLTREIPLMLQVGYSVISGVSASDSASNISFGFLDIAVIPTLVADPFEFFAGVQYSLGIGINSLPLPAGVAITSPSQLSSVWALGGVGYRIPLGYYSQLAFRLKYSMSFIQNPFAFQTITACVALEFRG
jgi:hypothetical protein